MISDADIETLKRAGVKVTAEPEADKSDLKEILQLLRQIANRKDAPAEITVEAPEVTVNPPAISVQPPQVHVQAPNVEVKLPPEEPRIRKWKFNWSRTIDGRTTENEIIATAID